MNQATNSQGEIRSFSRSYESALAKHLLRDSDSILEPDASRKLGNRALKLDIGLLGIAMIHENALDSFAKKASSAPATDERTRHSTAFFDSVIVPIEESRFTASETTNRLNASIKTLTCRTEGLDSSNKNLLLEIVHRKEVAKSLRTSEKTTSLLLEQARKMQEEMRSLSRQLITAQEDERKRISRELHDVIAQTLAAISVQLAVLRSQSRANAEDFHEKIENTERLVEQSVEIVHRFASDLRPVVLDDIGLIAALKTYISSFTDQYGIPVKLTASPAVEELDSSSLTALFRITQEALTNIGRHSKSSMVKINFSSTKDAFRMKIGDNGQGFAMTGAISARVSPRLGILGMRERAEMIGGSFRIDSAVGEGTVIQVELPRAAISPAKDNETKGSTSRSTKKSK